jgi:multiple sugar transport system ATP-binding protein
LGIEIDTGVACGVLLLPSETLRGRVGDEVIVGIRPERITDVRSAHGERGNALQAFDVRVDVIEPTGPDTLVFAQVNRKRVVSRVHPASSPHPDSNTKLWFDVSKAVVFDPATEQRIG